MGNKFGDRIRYFLQLRRQNDTVKLVCIFALAGAVFLGFTVYHVQGLWQYVAAPAEYSISGGGTISNRHIKELRQNKDVSGASRKMEIPVTVQYAGTEVSLNCIMLSQEYMEELLETEIPEGGSRIYMNRAAFREWQEAASENNANMAYEEGMGKEKGRSGKTVGEFSVRYLAEVGAAAIPDRSGDGGDDNDAGGAGVPVQGYRSAKLVVTGADGEEAESFIYTPETETLLLWEADGLRVRFARHDLDGLHVEDLRDLGYEIEDEEAVMAEEYGLQVKLLHIRYALLVCGICTMAAVVLWKRSG